MSPTRTAAEVRAEVLAQLAQLAPIADALTSALAAGGEVLLRDCGLDSFGTFQLVVSMEDQLGITIADDLFDARRCRSVDGVVDLLLEACAREAGT